MNFIALIRRLYCGAPPLEVRPGHPLNDEIAGIGRQMCVISGIDPDEIVDGLSVPNWKRAADGCVDSIVAALAVRSLEPK